MTKIYTSKPWGTAPLQLDFWNDKLTLQQLEADELHQKKRKQTGALQQNKQKKSEEAEISRVKVCKVVEIPSSYYFDGTQGSATLKCFCSKIALETWISFWKFFFQKQKVPKKMRSQIVCHKNWCPNLPKMSKPNILNGKNFNQPLPRHKPTAPTWPAVEASCNLAVFWWISATPFWAAKISSWMASAPTAKTPASSRRSMNSGARFRNCLKHWLTKQFRFQTMVEQFYWRISICNQSIIFWTTFQKMLTVNQWLPRMVQIIQIMIGNSC